MKETKIRSVYQARNMVVVQMEEGEPGKLRTGKVQQHFKNEVDINNIMRRYTETGVLQAPGMRSGRATFGDFSDVDFQGSLKKLNDANEAFMALPSRMRARFENDPAKLLEFVGNSRNREEAQSMGLLRPKAPQDVVPQGAEKGKTPPPVVVDGGEKPKA